jgi:hypothetical protein
MALNAHQRQQKLAKKKAKEKAKKKQLALRISHTPALIMAHELLHSQLHECYMVDSDFEDASRIQLVCMSRKLSGQRYLLCTFLIDIYCLGVKDTYFQVCNELHYNDFIRKMHTELPYVSKSPSYAWKFIQGAVDFANKFGFPPHSKFSITSKIFQGVNTNECDDTFVYGYEGKPLYVAGPYDSKERTRVIVNQLTSAEPELRGDYIVSMSRIPASQIQSSRGMQFTKLSTGEGWMAFSEDDDEP